MASGRRVKESGCCMLSQRLLMCYIQVVLEQQSLDNCLRKSVCNHGGAHIRKAGMNDSDMPGRPN
jgi:hypothetical protein